MKNNIDKINAFKGQKLAQEIVELMKSGKQNIDLSQYNEITQCSEENSQYKELIEKLTHQENYLLNDDNKHSDINKLVNTLNLKTKRRSLVRKLIYTSASIASALILSLLLWTNYGTIDNLLNPDNHYVTANKEISKPTLILSDGKDIDLTSESQNIADQNYTIKKQTNNTLAYNDNTANNRPENVKFNTIIVPSKYTYNLVLADGTNVTLNAGSKLKYPVHFSGDTREVFLEGEGYFKVTKDKKPFIVKTNEASLKVYGTEFNISDKPHIGYNAILVNGSIGITLNNSSRKEIFIKPSERLSYDGSKDKVYVDQVDTDNCIAWLDGYIRCDNEPLTSLISSISSWYGVDFTFINKKPKFMQVTVSLDRELPLEDMLSLIEKVINVKFIKEKGGSYTIAIKR